VAEDQAAAAPAPQQRKKRVVTEEMLKAGADSVAPPKMPTEAEVISQLQREHAVNQAKPRPVAIVGSAPSTRHWTPGNDDKQFEIPCPYVLGGNGCLFLPEWEVWAVGTVDSLERWDVFWDLHDPLTYGPEYKPYLKWMESQSKPVVVAKPHRWAKKPIIYPVGPMIQKYGTFFFTSTVAWMMALAIEMKVPKIGVFGIDMADSVEYRAQKAGCKHFATVAREKGIEVIVPPGSDLLFEPAPYPFVLEDPLQVKLGVRIRELGAYGNFHNKRDVELGQHVAAVEQERLNHRNAKLKIEGGIEALELVLDNWSWKTWSPKSPSGMPHLSQIVQQPLPPQPEAPKQ